MSKLNWAVSIGIGVALTGCTIGFGPAPTDSGEPTVDGCNAVAEPEAKSDPQPEVKSEPKPEPKPATPAPKVDRKDFKDRQKGMVLSVAMSADSKYFASACSDATVKIWSLGNSIREVKTITAKNEIGSVSFGDGGKKLATSHWGGELKLWDTATGKEIACKVKAPEGFVPISIALSPDGKTMAVGGLKDIKLFSVATGAVVSTFSGHNGKISNLVFSPDGKLLASASRDKTCKVWNIASGQASMTVPSDKEMLDISFQNGGKEIATFDYMNYIKLIDIASGKELFKYKANVDGLLSLGNMALSPDGQWLGMGNIIGSSFSISEIGQMFNWLKYK